MGSTSSQFRWIRGPWGPFYNFRGPMSKSGLEQMLYWKPEKCLTSLSIEFQLANNFRLIANRRNNSPPLWQRTIHRFTQEEAFTLTSFPSRIIDTKVLKNIFKTLEVCFNFWNTFSTFTFTTLYHNFLTSNTFLLFFHF